MREGNESRQGSGWQVQVVGAASLPQCLPMQATQRFPSPRHPTAEGRPSCCSNACCWPHLCMEWGVMPRCS